MNKTTVVRKPFIHPETGARIGTETITTYKICTDDCISKRMIIEWLENKIKEHRFYPIDSDYGEYRERFGQLIAFQEVLDFVKGGRTQ